MSLLLWEGFEHIRSDVDLGRRFPEANTGLPSSLPLQPGRLPGGRCLRIENDDVQFRTSNIGLGTDFIYLGFGIRIKNPESAWPHITILGVGNLEQLTLQLISFGGEIKFRLMRGATQLFLSDGFDPEVYYYFELEAKIHNSGYWKIRVNEMTISEGEGDTATIGNVGWDKLLFRLKTQSGAGNYVELDDLYVCNETGEDNTLLGAVCIEAFEAQNDGSEQSWAPNTGTNVGCVDDASSGGVDDDTTYVASPGIPGNLDLYLLGKSRSLGGGIRKMRAAIDTANSEATDATLAIVRKENNTKTQEASVTVLAGAGYATRLLDMGPLPYEHVDKSEYGFADGGI